jgi:hypothetical protein
MEWYAPVVPEEESDALISQFQYTGVFIHEGTSPTERGFTFLGTPVGTPEFVQSSLMGFLKRFETTLGILSRVKSVQDQYLLLTKSLTFKAQHLFRTLGPATTKEFAIQFRRLQLQALGHCTTDPDLLLRDTDASRFHARQAFLSHGQGGLGLLDPEVSRCIGYIQSWHLMATAANMATFFPSMQRVMETPLQPDLDSTGFPELPVHGILRNCFAALEEHSWTCNPFSKRFDAMEACSILSFSKIQGRTKDIPRKIRQVQSFKLVNEIRQYAQDLSSGIGSSGPLSTEARNFWRQHTALVGARAPYATRSLQVFPSRSEHRFNDHKMRLNLEFTLGAPLGISRDLHRCLHCRDALDGGLHLLSCLRGPGLTQTHHSVVGNLEQWIRGTTSFSTEREPRLLDSNGEYSRRSLRTDLRVFRRVGPQPSTAFDVSIVNVHSAATRTAGTSTVAYVSHEDSSTLHPLDVSLRAARVRELDKCSKYQAACAAQPEPSEFAPFVLELTGGWGTSTRRFLDVLSSGASSFYSLGELKSLQQACISSIACSFRHKVLQTLLEQVKKQLSLEDVSAFV